jgi:uncharacterized protein involved in exopolysaccharide biosynthesis
LSQEVDRLENERLGIEAQIADLRRRSNDIGAQQAAEQLAALKAALMQKSAIYSESHPDIIALKERISALQQSGGGVVAPPAQAIPQVDSSGDVTSPAIDSKEQGTAPVQNNASENTTISMLQSKEASVQQDLDKARERLLLARQGERLEEDQQSERFEVIEQPSVPQEPIKPNRKKLLAMGLALSIVAGFGGVFAIESYDKTIRGTGDLPMPPRLVVTIPYISTRDEIERSRKRLKIVASAAAVALIAILVMIHFLVLPLDLLFEKITNRLIGV